MNMRDGDHEQTRLLINGDNSKFLRQSFSDWEKAQQGSVTRLDLTGESLPHHEKHVPVLGQYRATAIAGNDITSSIFYTVGICATVAGKYTPISMFLVVMVLFLFKNIYSEVCTALPLNGGTYNVLLNTTSKGFAAVAAALSLLSYLVTSVVSANTAANYLQALYEPVPVFWTTIAILGFFALLNLMGLSESANVALCIFVMHLTTLFLLVLFALIDVIESGPKQLHKNWEKEPDYSPVLAIFYGFSVALLGVSGFESSSNYIEEQKDRVFPKTLRNMWICILLFNPIISVLALAELPLENITHHTNAVLVTMAKNTSYGNEWLKMVVGIDACIVLSGAVLTSYVGVIGLVKRMSMDRCLPQFLLAENSFRKTNHFIIIGFFLLTTSLMFITRGSVKIIAGVYTVAFLSVMALFAIGNIGMKYKRKKLPRLAKASWLEVFAGLFFVVAGLIGNIVYNPDMVLYFFIYFSATMFVIWIMFRRITLLRIFLFLLKDSHFLSKYFGTWATTKGRQIKNQPMVFFAKTDEIYVLNKAVLYVLENEITNCLKVVHVYQDESQIPPNLEANIKVLDQAYPKLTLDLILIKSTFCPEITDKLVAVLEVPKNLMFITCPGKELKHKISDFGGLRVITH